MKDHLDLQEFLKKNNIYGEILEMPRLTKTAQMAAEVLGVPADSIVKSVVFVTKSGAGVVGIVPGSRKVSHQKLESVIGETVNTASPEQVLALTGYKAGAVPPVGTGLRTFIDGDVLKNDFCIAGGGSDQHLIRISTHVLKKATNAVTADIKK